MEYKAADKYQDLNAAYQQLLQYRENLNNPPLLVVTDINHWEIHSNFPNTQSASTPSATTKSPTIQRSWAGCATCSALPSDCIPVSIPSK